MTRIAIPAEARARERSAARRSRSPTGWRSCAPSTGYTRPSRRCAAREPSTKDHCIRDARGTPAELRDGSAAVVLIATTGIGPRALVCGVAAQPMEALVRPLDLQADPVAAICAPSGPALALQIVWVFRLTRTWCVLRRADPGGLIRTLCCDSIPAAPVSIATSSLDPADHRRPQNSCPACELRLGACTPGAAGAVEPPRGRAITVDLCRSADDADEEDDRVPDPAAIAGALEHEDPLGGGRALHPTEESTP